MIELLGSDYSVYVRSARLALAEKGVSYHLSAVDVFAPGGPPDAYLALNPFAKIPTLNHDGFVLYESGAILRYVDEGFEGPALQPVDRRERARMNQILSVLDAYAYTTLVWEIFVERIVKTRGGNPPDEVRISSAMGQARRVVTALETLSQAGPFLLGERLTLADCHAAPMLHLFSQTEEGELLLKGAPGLAGWLDSFRSRPSFVETEPPSAV